MDCPEIENEIKFCNVTNIAKKVDTDLVDVDETDVAKVDNTDVVDDADDETDLVDEQEYETDNETELVEEEDETDCESDLELSVIDDKEINSLCSKSSVGLITFKLRRLSLCPSANDEKEEVGPTTNSDEEEKFMSEIRALYDVFEPNMREARRSLDVIGEILANAIPLVAFKVKKDSIGFDSLARKRKLDQDEGIAELDTSSTFEKFASGHRERQIEVISTAEESGIEDEDEIKDYETNFDKLWHIVDPQVYSPSAVAILTYRLRRELVCLENEPFCIRKSKARRIDIENFSQELTEVKTCFAQLEKMARESEPEIFVAALAAEEEEENCSKPIIGVSEEEKGGNCSPVNEPDISTRKRSILKTEFIEGNEEKKKKKKLRLNDRVYVKHVPKLLFSFEAVANWKGVETQVNLIEKRKDGFVFLFKDEKEAISFCERNQNFPFDCAWLKHVVKLSTNDLDNEDLDHATLRLLLSLSNYCVGYQRSREDFSYDDDEEDEDEGCFREELENFFEEQKTNFLSRGPSFAVNDKDVFVLTKFLLAVSETECLGTLGQSAEELRRKFLRHFIVCKSFFSSDKDNNDDDNLGSDLSKLQGTLRNDELSSLLQLQKKWTCPAFRKILAGKFEAAVERRTELLERDDISEMRIKLLLENGNVVEAKNLLRWYYLNDRHVVWYLKTLLENEDMEMAIDELAKKMERNNWTAPQSLLQIFEMCSKKVAKDEKAQTLMNERLVLKMVKSNPLYSTQIILQSNNELHLNQLLDTIAHETIHNKVWSFDTKTFLSQFVSVANKFPKILEKVQQFVIKLFQTDPRSYAECLFEICTDSQIEMLAGFLDFVLSDMNFDRSLEVMRHFLSPRNLERSSILKESVSEIIPKLFSKVGSRPSELCTVVKDFWVNNVLNLSRCLDAITTKFDDHFKSGQLLSFCRQLVEIRTDSLNMLITTFLYRVDTRIRANKETISNQSEGSNLVRKLPQIAKCSPDGCNGCNLLENFLLNPSKKESNITVNQKLRSCIRRVLERRIKDNANNRNVRIADLLALSYEELSRDENGRRFQNRSCGCVLVIKHPLQNLERNHMLQKCTKALDELKTLKDYHLGINNNNNNFIRLRNDIKGEDQQRPQTSRQEIFPEIEVVEIEIE